MAEQRSPSPALQIGQPFNPFKIFTGIFIPDALVRSKIISVGAKLTYGRLARYAGQDGSCYPAVPTLAAELGTSARQTQHYLAELERHKLIRRHSRFRAGAQTSNAVEFLWNELLEAAVKKTEPEGVKDPSPEGVKDPSLEGVKNPAPKESQTEESHCEETNGDIDCPPTNRKERDSRSGVELSPPSCKQYPRVREGLARYMRLDANDEKIYPSDRQVVDVMDAAEGGSEDDVLYCLGYLYNERVLRPGTRNGPRTFSWFATVVGDYFSQRRSREEVANPVGYHAWAERNETRLSASQFGAMTGAIEIDGSAWKP